LVPPRWGAGEYAGFVRRIAAFRSNLLWVNSYNVILREDARLGSAGRAQHPRVLSPRKGACNPSQRAIINGETETGVTLHEWTAGVDERPIIDQRRVPLFFADTWQMVFDRIARAADDLIAANLPKIRSSSWVVHSPDERVANYCGRPTPVSGFRSWAQPVVSIHNHLRTLLPPAFDGHWQHLIVARILIPAGPSAPKPESVRGRHNAG
jgi:UDP-4-amino-4-deoxy-L-arabinose formyltransferase/UDP-glucuronic acid dehydrogenase (UDP-4-keto-hexauronic acid decarboxylating)